VGCSGSRPENFQQTVDKGFWTWKSFAHQKIVSMMREEMPVTLTELNSSSDDTLTDILLACCDVPAWAGAVKDGRPYSDVDSLLAVADDAARRFDQADVDRALEAHPRIGERARGRSTEAGWSRQEQAGVAPDAQTRQALDEGNREYEDRFGRVFLVCASGMTGPEILTALRARLGNDPATEAAVAADELRKIALLRLRRVVEEGTGA
jgi:2-oxo-4-hydroxy-4-carboxy-5-ureidoimidazoline decarboxylase